MLQDLFIFTRWMLICVFMALAVTYIKEEFQHRWSKDCYSKKDTSINDVLVGNKPWWVVAIAVLLATPWAPETKVGLWVGGMIMLTYFSYLGWKKLPKEKSKQFAVLGFLGLLTIAIFTRLTVFS